MARRILPKPSPSIKDSLTPTLIGHIVNARRTQQGLRIDVAAQLCGVSVTTISRIETGKAGVRMESLFRVLNGLGLKMRMDPW